MGHSYRRKQALETEIVSLYAKITIGGTGAPTLTNAPGFTGISRTSAGLYVLTLDDAYVSLKDFSCIHLKSTVEDLKFQLSAETVASTKLVTFLCLAVATATDPSSGDLLYIRLDLKRSSNVI